MMAMTIRYQQWRLYQQWQLYQHCQRWQLQYYHQWQWCGRESIAMPASGWRPFSGGKSLSIGLGGDRHVGDDDHHHMDGMLIIIISVMLIIIMSVMVVIMSVMFHLKLCSLYVSLSYLYLCHIGIVFFPWMESMLGTVYSCEHHRAVSLLATPLHSCTWTPHIHLVIVIIIIIIIIIITLIILKSSMRSI